jgi:Fic family protein
MDTKLFSSLTAKKAQLDRLRPFPKAALERLHNQFVVEWTYNSNAIEGNTLSLKETALILNEGLTISGKPLREHFEAVNHREAILKLEEFIRNKHPLNESAVLGLHKIILKGISDEDAGFYRRHSVRILGANHIPPNALKVPALMKNCLAWYKKSQTKLHPVQLSALLHHKLVYIHPFIDGNGRLARLLMNLVLMRHGYPPVVILKVDRRKYYRLLQQADHENFEDYLNFIARAVERSLIIYLRALTPATKLQTKQGYVSLAEAAKGTSYSQEYLSLLARKGILPAVKFRRNWMTTHDAVHEYISGLKQK